MDRSEISAHEVMAVKALMDSDKNLNRRQKFSDDFRKVSARIAVFLLLRDDKAGVFGRVEILYPRDGAGVLRIQARMPGEVIHLGRAGGFGYNKTNAAMHGSVYQNIQGAWLQFADRGMDWKTELENAGYRVYQVI